MTTFSAARQARHPNDNGSGKLGGGHSEWSPGQRWHNWGRNVSATPQQWAAPRSEEEVSSVIRRAAEDNLQLRMVGAGYAFTPLAASNDVMLSLEHWSGIEYLESSGEVTVRGGTRLDELGRALHALGRAQEHWGNAGPQHLAAAISTGTHGSALSLGSLSTQVTGLRLIDAQGQLHHMVAGDPRLCAARLSLGALGVITAVTLHTQPSELLRQEVRPGTLNEMLALAPEYARTARHFEFEWTPQTAQVQVKRIDVASGALAAPGRSWPSLPASARRALGLGSLQRTDYAHTLLALAPQPRFREMEYALALDALPSALRDLGEVLRGHVAAVTVRFTRGDDIWLSPAYGRESVYLAVQAEQGAGAGAHLRGAEAVFIAHGGRPHWGKLHSLSHAELGALYPNFKHFQAARDHLDPARRFGSAYLSRILGH